MKAKERLSVNKYTKILVPANTYEMAKDKRLLIPFTNGERIGFVNHDGSIIVKPQFIMYYGDCYNDSDLIRVAVDFTYGFARKGGSVAAYHRPLYGLLNAQGEIVLATEHFSLIPSIGSKRLFTIQNKDYSYAVLDEKETVIVPFGKYDWIDGFDKGLARVKIGKKTNGEKFSSNKWGIINEKGEEVLPVEYDEVWNFYEKNRCSTTVKINGNTKEIYFHDLNPSLSLRGGHNSDDLHEDDNYGTHYGEYAGSYAQDVMGYSDDVINDAFDGEPDAYWNID